MAKPRPAPAKKASDPMTLLNLTAGKWVSQAIAVVAELGIADLLKDGPRTAADVARRANASEDGVYRLLRALGSVGLFAESGNRKLWSPDTTFPGSTLWWTLPADTAS
jgi:hypothetical protein